MCLNSMALSFAGWAWQSCSTVTVGCFDSEEQVRRGLMLQAPSSQVQDYEMKSEEKP